MLILRDIKVSLKLASMIFVAILGFLVLLFTASQTLESNLLHEKEQRLSAVVHAIMTQLSYLDQTLPEKEAEKQAKALIRSMRFDESNYVFVLDTSRTILLNPGVPGSEGQQMGHSRNNPKDEHWFRMIDVSRDQDGGVVRYPFKDAAGKINDKLSYVKLYSPWGWVLGSGMLVENIDEQVHSQLLRMGGYTLLIIVVMTILSSIISRSMIIPLENIREAMLKLVKGDLTVKVPIMGKDEIGMVARCINDSINSVHTALNESVSSAKLLAEAANRIATSADSNNQAVSMQRDRLTQIATAMNQMSTTVAEVANHAESMAKDTLEATNEAELGDKDVSFSIDSISVLSKELELATNQVNKLKEGVMEIGDVTTVISSISEQTNLLALNAAIEAARAGEQGRGFAVVADEVRNLASRTNESTEEIQHTINRLQQLAINTSETMQKSQDLAGDSVERAEGSGNDLKQIVEHIQHISDKSAQVATAAEEQSAVAEDINQNISGINDAAMDMSDSTKDLATESENLASMSQQLDMQLTQFKL
ncbi:methyl-accepting chemotaxis protein [Vibrio quintilis]|uniref:Methyl-accepting chemotaxis protein 4 n=1 Tax=Vibrio quintilis TaxID=1117707 RepID=A0A1M7YVB3_9VIBR|nr:methyl-accepting chemotaxis protein [Vibrio quintilis]SHO56406.1 Methyl-accepting chemotaxis protein 4 [Vibrio quintilis]